MNEQIEKMILRFGLDNQVNDAVGRYTAALINDVVQLHTSGTDVFAYYGIKDSSQNLVNVDLELPDDELFEYMCIAHDKDITFNRFVVNALQAAMDKYSVDPTDQ
jgi:hypothetical protein